MDESRIPILVGCGQITQRESDPNAALSPIDLTADAARMAAEDSGAGNGLLQALDTIVVIRSFSDTSWRFKSPFGGPSNPPKSVARRLGADALVERIAGKFDFGMVVGRFCHNGCPDYLVPPGASS